MEPGQLAKVLTQEIEELSQEVRRYSPVVGTARRACTARLCADFDSIVERLEYAKYDGACRIVRSARAAFVEAGGALSHDTVNYLTSKITEMLREAASWVSGMDD